MKFVIPSSIVIFALLILTCAILATTTPTARAWGCHASNGQGANGASWSYTNQHEAVRAAMADCKYDAREHGQSQACRVVCSPLANTREVARALR